MASLWSETSLGVTRPVVPQATMGARDAEKPRGFLEFSEDPSSSWDPELKHGVFLSHGSQDGTKATMYPPYSSLTAPDPTLQYGEVINNFSSLIFLGHRMECPHIRDDSGTFQPAKQCKSEPLLNA